MPEPSLNVLSPTQVALGAHHVAPARESMVIVAEATGDLFAEPFAPDRAGIRAGASGDCRV